MVATRVLARNSMLNIVGQAVPMLAAIVSIPILLRHLGPARFGVLSLAWAAIGYFSFFDLGLGRALTQAVAERLGRKDGDSDLTDVAWVALIAMLLLGAVGGVVLAVVSPWLIYRVLHITPGLVAESLGAFYLLALSMPSVVSTAGFRGLLEAHQDFGAATALRIPLAVFTFLAPLAVLPYSVRLVPIVAVLVVGRYLTFAAHVWLCVARYAYLRHRPSLRLAAVMPLARLGGWMTMSNIASPIMAYLDRFFIGATLAMTAVAFYVTPYEIVTKLLVIPNAMIAVMFPAFAASYVDDPTRTALLFERVLRVLIILIFPIVLVVILFAREALSLWVGGAFAETSAPVLRWLAVGVFANALAQAPFAMLQGTGRPDITAKLHLVELPLYIASLAWLASTLGIVGVAIAWTARVIIDSAILLALARVRMRGTTIRVDQTLVVGACGLLVLIGACFVAPLPARVLLLVTALCALAAIGWSRLMLPNERVIIKKWAGT